MLKTIRYSWVLLICLLASCGFHLRGHADLPPQLQRVYVAGQSPYSPLIKQIKTTLRDNGVTVVDEQHAAPITIAILHSAIDQATSTVSSNAQVRQLTLTMHLHYQLTTATGKPLVTMPTLQTQRIYTSNANQILGDSGTIEREYVHSMYRDISMQLLLALSAQEVRQRLHRL